MKRALILVAVLLLGFVLGAGVGFKILEGVSGDIVAEAFANSYSGFNQTSMGNQFNNKIGQIEIDIKQKISSGLKSYIGEKIDSIF